MDGNVGRKVASKGHDRRLGLRVHHVAVVVGGDDEPLGSG
jgi:hypothetical protein